MQYEYRKSAPLNAEEKQRLRTALAVELRFKGLIQRPPPAGLGAALLAMLQDPATPTRPELREWALCFCRARLLERFLAEQLPVLPKEFACLQQAGRAALLPMEYLCPEFQRIGNFSNPARTLVCFTGVALRMNIPVQLFHALAAGYFDQILYLRDPGGVQFSQGLPGIAPGFDAMTAMIMNCVPAESTLSVLGVSSGGYGAARLAEQTNAARVALFSPNPSYQGAMCIGVESRVPAEAVKLYLAERNPMDQRFAEAWSGSAYGPSIAWLNTDSHATLRYLYEKQQLETVLSWLSGRMPLRQRLSIY